MDLGIGVYGFRSDVLVAAGLHHVGSHERLTRIY